MYRTAASFDLANSRYSSLIQPILSDLSENELVSIIEAPTKDGGDLNGAWSFNQFLAYVYDKKRLPLKDITKLLKAQALTYPEEELKKHVATEKAVDDD